MFVLDPMHLVFLGVMRRLLVMFWIEGKRGVKLPKSVILNINNQIKSNKKHIASEFTRKLRTLKDAKRWKATEFRFFLLYLGPLLLRSQTSSDVHKHFLLLHAAVFILSSQHLTNKYIATAKLFLTTFVKMGAKMYGKYFVVYNIHSLIHICDDVALYGDLNSYSCFPFENYLGKLKRSIRGKYRLLQQIHNRLREYNNTEYEETAIHIKPFHIFDRNSNYFQCSKLQINNNLFISISAPDNIVAVGKNFLLLKQLFVLMRFLNV